MDTPKHVSRWSALSGPQIEAMKSTVVNGIVASGDIFASKAYITQEVDSFARKLSTKRIQTQDDADKSRIVDRQFLELEGELRKRSRTLPGIDSDILQYTIRRMASSPTGLAALARLVHHGATTPHSS